MANNQTPVQIGLGQCADCKQNQQLWNCKHCSFSLCTICFVKDRHDITLDCKGCNRTLCGYNMRDENHCYACFAYQALQISQASENAPDWLKASVRKFANILVASDKDVV